MRKRFLLMVVAAFAGFAIVSPALAAGDDVTPISATTETGQSLYAASTTYTVSDDVTNDVVVAAEEVIIEGNVADNVFVAGGNILIDGDVNGDVLVAGGNVVINGSVGGDLRLVGGQVYINSEFIGGEVFIPGAGYVSISEQTTHEGKRHITAGTLVQNATDNPTDLTGFVKGNYFPGLSQFDAQTGFSSLLAGLTAAAALFTILLAAGTYAASYGILRFFPVMAENSLVTMTEKPWQSILVGGISILLAPFVVLFLLLTIVGIPILGILMLLGVIVWLFGNIYANYLIGRLLLKQMNMNKTGRALPLLFGSIVVWLANALLGIVPVLGFLFGFTVTSWGSGAMILNKWNMLRAKKK